MKKTLLLMMGIFTTLLSYSQFIVLNPNVSINAIEDIETGENERIIFATDNGILIYDNTNGNWKHFDKTNGLQAQKINALTTYPGGFLYSAGKIIGKCDYTTVSTAIDIFSTAAFDVTALDISNGHDTVIGTSTGNTYLFKSTGRWDITDFNSQTQKVEEIDHFTNNFGEFQIIVTNNKSFLLQSSSNQQVVLDDGTPGILSNRMLSHTVDGTRSYIGTDKGLFWADLKDLPPPQITIFQKSSTIPLPSDTINAVATKYGYIFFGTPKGLAVFANKRWKVYTTANSNLPSEDIAELTIDGNVLWIGTKQGDICKIGVYDATGISEETSFNPVVSFYPNPATDRVTIELGAEITGKVNIYDIYGKEIMEQEIVGNSIKLQLPDFPSGTYLYKITDRGSAYYNGKFSINR